MSLLFVTILSNCRSSLVATAKYFDACLGHIGPASQGLTLQFGSSSGGTSLSSVLNKPPRGTIQSRPSYLWTGILHRCGVTCQAAGRVGQPRWTGPCLQPTISTGRTKHTPAKRHCFFLEPMAILWPSTLKRSQNILDSGLSGSSVGLPSIHFFFFKPPEG